VELNVLADFAPEIPSAFQDSRYVFLANAHPATQASVLEQLDAPLFTLLDTMNLWIDTARRELCDLLPRVDALIVNHHEALQLTGRPQVLAAASAILDMGVRIVVIKKGEHGALLVTRDEYFALPAYPVVEVRDTTGAGDSFAGGFMGYLASRGGSREVVPADLRRALLYGTILGSFHVEGYGLDRLRAVSSNDVEQRREQFLRMIQP
jgi:sugar/nucleoside kinase (ribokinase family)